MNTDEVRKRFKRYATLNGLDQTFDTESGRYVEGACYYESDTQAEWQGYQQGIKDSEASLELAFNQGYSDGLSDGDSIADSSESRGDWEKSNLYEDLNHD